MPRQSIEMVRSLVVIGKSRFLLKEGKEEPLQPVPKMLGSAEGISDMGSVAHVLALDALDAVKEVATTR